MKKARMYGLTLVLCLLLSACGGVVEAEPEPGQVSFLGQAAGMEDTAVLLTVDGREIPAWRYLYWLADVCGKIAAQYGEPVDWAMPVSGGTLADYARDQALADTALYAVVENRAEKYACALTDADRQTLAEGWEQTSAEQGGEAAYLASLAQDGLDRSRAEELAGVSLQYARLYECYCQPDSPLAPEEETMKARAEEQGLLTVDRILIPIGEDRAAAAQQAAEVFSALNRAEDPAAVFAELAAAHGDIGGPRSLTAGDGTLSPVLEAAAVALAEGQCSGILEDTDGFSILRRLPTDTAAVRELCFDRMLEEDARNAAVQTTEAYRRLDAADFFQHLTALRSSAAG